MHGEGLISGAAGLPFSVPRIASALPHTGPARQVPGPLTPEAAGAATPRGKGEPRVDKPGHPG